MKKSFATAFFAALILSLGIVVLAEQISSQEPVGDNTLFYLSDSEHISRTFFPTDSFARLMPGPLLWSGKKENRIVLSVNAITRGELNATLVRGEAFGIAMSIVKKDRVEHPCPQNADKNPAARCRFSLELTDGSGRTWDVRQILFVGIEENSMLFSLDGEVPGKAETGNGIVRVTVTVPALPYPVFTYHIPVMVK